MQDNRIQSERNRLIAILKGVNIPSKKQDVLCGVIDNLAWMRVKLDDTREQMTEESVTVAYDNGGGQTGIRENPIFKGYEKLLHSYIENLKVYASFLPVDLQDEVIDDGMTMLSRVREMRQ